jgi:ABC-type multidrug transport system fused ATPase/permease subunit
MRFSTFGASFGLAMPICGLCGGSESIRLRLFSNKKLDSLTSTLRESWPRDSIQIVEKWLEVSDTDSSCAIEFHFLWWQLTSPPFIFLLTLADLTWFFRFSIESVVRITGITVYMLIRSPRLGACALSIIPIVAIVNKYYGNWLSQNARKVQDALAEANSVAQETLSCIRTVIAFASETFEYDKYVEKVNVQYELNVRQVSNNSTLIAEFFSPQPCSQQ